MGEELALKNNLIYKEVNQLNEDNVINQIFDEMGKSLIESIKNGALKLNQQNMDPNNPLIKWEQKQDQEDAEGCFAKCRIF